VLLLGPVVAIFAFLYRERGTEGEAAPSFSLSRFVPWFVLGFALLATLRTAGAIPDWMASDVKKVSTYLTAVAMAGLGLGVDLGMVRASGARVGLVVVALTVLLVVMSLTLVHTLGIG
jgi:uncharacterized membrane protein YadS